MRRFMECAIGNDGIYDDDEGGIYIFVLDSLNPIGLTNEPIRREAPFSVRSRGLRASFYVRLAMHSRSEPCSMI